MVLGRNISCVHYVLMNSLDSAMTNDISILDTETIMSLRIINTDVETRKGCFQDQTMSGSIEFFGVNLWFGGGNGPFPSSRMAVSVWTTTPSLGELTCLS